MLQQVVVVGGVTALSDYILVMISPVTYGSLSPQVRAGVAAAAAVAASQYLI